MRNFDTIFLSFLQDECQNYIRVLAQTDPHNLLVCGTNSFNPKCRTYSTIGGNSKEVAAAETEDSSFKMQHEFSGRGFCPYDPKHNSTAIFTGKKTMQSMEG